ncbi:D-alanyl-D-alanine carboxypeptidase/D-alanyl-D-alanine-endopeptidase, partial [Myxococcota bacterium]|nr:D-alanyl-D-alanine carboxypeptidase/D-alanyl-D-alanine-endopeptidase [Myxococcota bacterium]
MKYFSIYFSFAFLLTGSALAETPQAQEQLRTTLESTALDLKTQLLSIIHQPGLSGAKVGLYVENLNSGEVLFSHQADEILIPASNIKLITTATALHYLGPDYRFKTKVWAPKREGSVVKGDIYVVGNGDPYLVPERLFYLATRIYFEGVREIHGDIIIDDSYFAGERQALGFEKDHSSFAYMAPAGAVSVGFNAILVHVKPGSQSGDPAQVVVDPVSDYAPIEGEITTTTRSTRLYVTVDAAGDRSVVKVSGRINIKESGRSYWRRINNPPVFAGEVFKKMLMAAGVKTTGKVKTGIRPIAVEEDEAPLAVLSSPRLAELIESVNKYSNNFMAAQIARATGAAVYGVPGTWQKAERAINWFLENEVKSQLGSWQIGNASGLHDVNRLSPRVLVDILRYMHASKTLSPEFRTSLAVAGGTGTLRNRMDDTPANALLRAKTGTLSSASSLSGYV